MAASLDKIVANLHLNDGADPGEAVDHHRNQRAVAQAEEIRLSGRLWIIGWFLGNGDALEQRMGFLNRQDRRLAFLNRVPRTPDRMGRISLYNIAGTQPVEEHANRSQVLLDGGRRKLVLQVVHEGGDMEWLDLRELMNLFGSAPVGKAAGGVHIGSSGHGGGLLWRGKDQGSARGILS